MGFFGDVATSLLVMKVDTTDMRAKLRQLKGDEREVVKAQIESAEARNRSIEGYGKALVKVNTILTTMTKAVQFGAESFKAFEEHTKLSAATSKYSLDSLRKASAGLKTDLDLMRLAQKAAGAQHSISQKELENATKAARAFEAAGFDGAKVQEKLGEALLKGSIEPLKDLGVNLEAAKGKTGQMVQLMDVLGKKSREAGSGVNEQTDEFRRAGVEYQNAMNKLKVAVGEIVVSLAPLISALADVVGLVADIADNARGGFETLGEFFDRGITPLMLFAGQARGRSDDFVRDPKLTPGSSEWLARDQREHPEKYNEKLPGYAAGGFLSIQANAAFQQFGYNMLGGKPDQWNILDEGAPKKKKGGKKKKDGTPIGFIELENTGEIVPVYGNEVADATSRAGAFLTEAGGGAARSLYGQDLGRMLGGSGGPTDAMFGKAQERFNQTAAIDAEQFSKMLAGLNQFVASGILAEDQSFLTSIFGPIDEFNAYASAFDVLSGTLQSGFDAWVSGSGSAAEAMKAFFKNAISGVASQMFAQAISHGAHAIGSLAFGLAGGPAGAGHMAAAAMHAKAAAGFAAGAAIVGGIARATGGGAAATGSGASAGGARAPSVIGGGTGAGGGNQAITVIVGDIWAADNQRKKNRDVARAVRSAERELQGSRGVTRR